MTSYWCLSYTFKHSFVYKRCILYIQIALVMDVEMTLCQQVGSVLSVPMARGKHLFPYRTQQLSLAAVTILGVHPWENSTVPNYIKAIRIGWLLSSQRVNIISLTLFHKRVIINISFERDKKRVPFVRAKPSLCFLRENIKPREV